MHKKKIAFLVVIIGIILNVLIFMRPEVEQPRSIDFTITVNSEKEDTYSVYYNVDETFSEGQVSNAKYQGKDIKETLEFTVLSNVNYLRIDFGVGENEIFIHDFYFKYKDEIIEIDSERIIESTKNQVDSIIKTKNGPLKVSTDGEDPYCIFYVGDLNIKDTVDNLSPNLDLIKKIISCLVLDILLLGFIKFYQRVFLLPIELFHNRKLIFDLAKNDFKTKFAGSYLGIIWAFIQPIVTVLVYWFVFEKGLRSQPMEDFPFVLWLIAGLVPWFFFSDSLNGGTSALIEYNYLVKKVVFKISILPIVKIISALFVHLFFVVFTLIMYSAYGYYPDLYSLQLIYYSLCTFVFVLGICYATCAIVIFFRDLNQIISIILQVGVWMTPIMWNHEILSKNLQFIFKLNPMFYIVSGYRDALINKVWFWDNFYLTIYFWVLTAGIFGFGALIFKRLKVHFADVL